MYVTILLVDVKFVVKCLLKVYGSHTSTSKEIDFMKSTGKSDEWYLPLLVGCVKSLLGTGSTTFPYGKYSHPVHIGSKLKCPNYIFW